MKPIPSCVVYADHVDPDTGKKTGKITFQNVDVLADPLLALEVLQKEKDLVDHELSDSKPRTDAYLTNCAKKRDLLQVAIQKLLNNDLAQTVPGPIAERSSRKDQAIRRKLLRKAAKIDQARK